MESSRLRVVIADDHPMVRAGLTATINAEADMIVVAAASNGAEALALFREHQPDIAIIDLRMPVMDGVETIERILQMTPAARILVLSTYHGDEAIFRSLKAGAKSYLTKDVMEEELVGTIRRIAAGGRAIPPAVSEKLADRMHQTPLSPRELEVLKLIAKGLRNKEIAAALGIADQTVEGHVRNILEKLAVRDRVEALTVAVRRGIVFLD